MSNPGTYNLKAQRRATLPIDLTFKSGGNPVDITGYTFAASVFDETRTQSYGDFSVTYVNRSQGKILFKLTPAQTALFTPDVLIYDVKYKQPNNDEFYLIEGKITVSEGVTVIA